MNETANVPGDAGKQPVAPALTTAFTADQELLQPSDAEEAVKARLDRAQRTRSRQQQEDRERTTRDRLRGVAPRLAPEVEPPADALPIEPPTEGRPGA
jgi:hypothetical protein